MEGKPATKKETIDFLSDVIIKKNERILELERIINTMRLYAFIDNLDKVIKTTSPWTGYNPVVEAERLINEKTK